MTRHLGERIAGAQLRGRAALVTGGSRGVGRWAIDGLTRRVAWVDGNQAVVGGA